MNNNEEIKNKETGLDRLNWQPDYSKSREENDKAFREQYKEVYGEYPPEMEDVK